jgi:hypothetical protein
MPETHLPYCIHACQPQSIAQFPTCLLVAVEALNMISFHALPAVETAAMKASLTQIE